MSPIILTSKFEVQSLFALTMFREVYGLNSKYCLSMYMLASTHDILRIRIICLVTK